MNRNNYIPVEQQFAALALQQPAAPAVQRDDLTLSYAELDRQANRLANFLLQAGMQPDMPLLVFVADPLRVIPLLIACFRAGVIFVPVNTREPESRLRNIVQLSGAKHLILDQSSLSSFNSMSDILPADGQVMNMDEVAVTDLPDTPLSFSPDQDAPCYIYFSSGSTGAPKAIAGNRNGIAHFIAWERQTLATDATLRVSQLTQPFYDAFLRDVFLPLCSGGTVCVPDNPATVLDIDAMLEWIKTSGVNLIHTIPSVLRRCLDHARKAEAFQNVRYILLAGERVLPNDIARWYEQNTAGTQLINLYGPSETVMTKLFYPLSVEDQHRKTIPIGRPMQDVDVLLLDEQQNRVPAGKIGEICIATDFVLCGYYNRPELSDRVFIAEPGNPARKIYKTGDFGRVIDEQGNIEFLGRKDQQVKINGIRVELSEIEDRLNAHADIRQSVVQAFERDGQVVVVAYLVTDNAEMDELKHRLFNWLDEVLPHYMQPRYYQRIEEIPRLPNGKIKYAALPALNKVIETNSEQPFFKAALQNPETLTELNIYRIWCRVLGINMVGVEENFFEAGGESLLVFNVLNEIEQTFAKQVPLAVFLQQPTIRGLAQYVDRDGTAPTTPFIDLNKYAGNAPPLWLVHPPGGDVLSYAALATRLEPACQVKGLLFPTLYGAELDASLEKLGENYARLILAEQPHGAITIGGWSAGGINALAVAESLIRAGREVAQVIMFDTVSPYPNDTTDLDRQAYTRRTMHNSLSSLIRFIAEGFNVETTSTDRPVKKKVMWMLRLVADQFQGMRLPMAEFMTHQIETCRQLEQLIRRLFDNNITLLERLPLRLLYLLPAQLRLKLILTVARRLHITPDNFDSGAALRFMSAFRDNMQLVCHYRPVRTAAKIVLIRAVDKHGHGLAALDSWHQVAMYGAEEIILSGDHYSIFREPRVGELAQAVRKIMHQ
ncbi:MAG: amino acid adenylation domain-containing protein [Gammaproteobacteria bacterium]|nr:amino acid adenylation domain-containing protein [Gammaproteobacteria bacterium]MDH5653619.1 amino acid adenylation domain-containing protein [Gammaproteobacteria bacterium]